MLLQLLDPLPIAGDVATADALHIQVETARYLVEDQKADYVLTVKGNHRPCEKTSQISACRHFPTQHTAGDGVEVRSIWTNTQLAGYLTFPYAHQVYCIQGDTTLFSSTLSDRGFLTCRKILQAAIECGMTSF